MEKHISIINDVLWHNALRNGIEKADRIVSPQSGRHWRTLKDR